MLLPRHAWQTLKGCRTVVLDRGAVQFDYPRSWFVEPNVESVVLVDQKPPADESRLEVSYLRIPPVDWSGLPVADFLDRATSKPREHATCGPLREEIRRGIELAWRDTNFISAKSPQQACFRVCVARHGGILCLITYEFWGGNRAPCDHVWQTVLETLELDRMVSDARRGPQTEGRR